MSNYWRKKLNELNEESNNTDNYWQNKMDELENAQKEDIAPVKDADDDKKWYQKIFQKSSAAGDDGWQLGDIAKAGRATSKDAMVDVYAGMSKFAEGFVDFGATLLGAGAKLVGADNFSDEMSEFVAKDIINEQKVGEVLHTINGGWMTDLVLGEDSDNYEEMSVLGETSDGAMQAVGDILTAYISGGVSKSATLAKWLPRVVQGVTAAGGEAEHAFQNGATSGEALVSGTISGGAAAILEGLSGGIKFGGDAVDDFVLKQISTKINNQLGRTLAKFGLHAVGEGAEEWLEEDLSNFGRWITYQDDKTIKEMFLSEEAFDAKAESFFVGSLLGGAGSVGKSALNIADGKDAVTGLTKNEQKVFDKVYEDAIAEAEKGGKKLTNKEKNEIYDNVMKALERGEIDTDTIEEVLGGEAYNRYKATTEKVDALKKQIEDLENTPVEKFTVKQKNQLAKATEELKRIERAKTVDAQKSQLSESVQGLLVRQDGKKTLTDDYLIESYNEDARRKQAFEVDLSKYEGKTKEILQNLMDKKQVNNSRYSHEFWEYAAKAVAERGGNITSATTEEILEMARKKYGNEYVEKKFKGKRPDAFVLDDGTIAINVKSPKARSFLLGHEIAHTMEKAGSYKNLAKLLLEYDKSKTSEADQKTKQKETEDRYDGIIGAEADKEYIADLVGKYIYDDADFIRHLSTKDRNLFQKIWDEVKHLYKMATAGSKEQRDLLRIEREFAKIYRETGKVNAEAKAEQTTTETNAETKYSLTGKTADGIEVYETSQDTMRLTWDERRAKYLDVMKNEYRGRTAKFERNGHTYYATFDQGSIRKPIYGDSRSSENGKKALIKAGADGDVFDLVENSAYKGSKQNTKDHTDADYFDYFVKTVQIDGKVFDLVADVEKKYGGDGGYVYTLALRDNKTIKASPTHGLNPVHSVGNAFSNGIISQNSKKSSGSEKFSLSDSEGKQLTKEQSDYFKDSKVRDENGNLKVMYHGTPNGDFTVFKDGTYFTENKWYADLYQNPGASSISTGKVASNPKTFEVYLDIKKPFDISDPEARSIYINDYIKGGNAVGINPYLSDAEYGKINSIDWTEGEDLRDFLIDNGYDYDGLVLDEGAVGGYGDEVKQRGKSYVVFDPKQVKNVDNLNPTSDPDIRFSLSKKVEETKDLVALHNVRADKLIEAFKLGGLPSPSVAITKSDILHDNYGDITLLLRKDAVDPQADSRNKVYGSDAWTPTISNARTEYEVDSEKARAFEEKLAELGKKIANGVFSRESLVRAMGIDDTSDQDAKRLSERLANYDEVRAAYLADIGKTIEPEYKAKVYNKFGNKALQTFIDQVGVQHLATLAAESKLGNMDGIRAEEETVRKIIRDTYAEERAYSLNRRPDLKEKRIDAYMEKNVHTFTIEDFVLDAWEFYQDGGAVTEEIDRLATSDKLRQAVNDSDVRAWLEPQIAEFLGEPGIYNGKEVFYSDGRRRSFAETHYTYTAENIVKAMQNAPARGSGTFGAHATSLIATATPSYKSIDEMHADKGRLKVENQATYDNILRDIDAVLESVEHDIMRTTKHHADNTFDEEQIIGSIITEAATGKRTVEAVQRAFAKEGYRISTDQAKKILALYDQAARVPTGYFEAKPERVVGFDEVAAFIIPNNADVKLKQELLNRGYSIAEYDPDVEGSRQKVVNSFEEYKFSLSREGETPERMKGLAPLTDAYIPTQEDIAPIREDIAENATTTPTVSKMEQVEDAERIASLDDKDAPPIDTDQIKTVEERLAVKLENTRKELTNNRRMREQSNAEYDQEIARLQAEYDAKTNKTTKVANDILRRIERLQRMKGNVDADYAKRISDLEQKVERMNSPEYKTAAQRMEKQQEYSDRMEELVGDTSTWVDKKMGISYKTNTLRRNLRDIVRDADGNRDIAKADAIYDELQGAYNQHEANLNRESHQIKNPYANMKITKAEDAYIQMLGEFRHNPDTTLTEDVVKEFYEKNKDNIDVAKVDKAIDMARKTYDDLLLRVNEVLREQGMKEIPYRQGYFPHFTEEKQGFLARLLNWKTQNNDIPTDIAGLTEQFNPNRSWQSFNKQRKGDTTDYSFTRGLDTYVHGALDWIHHIEDIQKRRALENHIRYIHSEKGVQEKVDAIRKNENYDADEMQEQIDLVYKTAGNPLNNFVTDLRAGTNRLANKKSSLDRSMEEMTNRKIYSTMTNLSNRLSANMVGGSVSSALTNFIPITQSWGEVSPISTLRGMGETIKSIVRDDGMVDKSSFLTNRLRKEENLYKTTWDKIGDKIGLLFDGVDNFTSQTIWRSKYHENINNGMSESEAIKNADQFAANVMADRSRGNTPTIFDSKNPLIKTLTAFQLEVNNQYGYMFKDMPQDVGTESKANLVKGYVAMFVGAYAYNALYSSLTGRNAAFDPINIVKELLEDLGLFGDDEEEEPTDAIMNLAENVLEEVPFVGGLLGGGRIPISSAMPYDDGLFGALSGTMEDIADKDWEGLTKEWMNPVYYLAMPMGGGQLRKTVQGLSMFSDEHPIAGSYTDSGDLRFPVDDTLGNRVQAALFGQWANKNAQNYLDNERSPLNAKQIQEFKKSGLSIDDYWGYRDGLKGLDTLAEKAEYINDLDFPIATKNQFINNIANRKDDIDLTDYDDYGRFEEFDYAENSPEMYSFLKENGISYREYKGYDEDTKRAWTWAYKNPEKYSVSKAVSEDFMKFYGYKKALSDLEADKDEDGKSISGSKKKKVIDYINNNLNDLDYGQKIILYRSMYNSQEDRDAYNMDIVNYLNSRNDISYEEMETILKELGFTVSSDGTITWD